MKLTKYLAVFCTALLLMSATGSSWATYHLVNGKWVYVDDDNDRSDNDRGRDNDRDNDNDHGRDNDRDDDNDHGRDNDRDDD